MRCSNCNSEINNTESKCSVCGYYYALDKNKNLFKEIVKIFKFLYIFPLALAGFIFTCVGAYCLIDERMSSKNYIETTGILKSFKTDIEGYTGVYEYKVDDEVYSVSPNKLTSKDSFPKEEIVMYNPDNPEEAIISADWHILLIGGIVLLGIFMFLFCRNFKKVKK